MGLHRGDGLADTHARQQDLREQQVHRLELGQRARGALLSVQEAGVRALLVPTIATTRRRCSGWHGGNGGAKVLAPAEGATRVMSPAERVLTGLPGLGWSGRKTCWKVTCRQRTRWFG